MLPTLSRPRADPAPPPQASIRVALATDDAQALQAWRRELACEGVQLERLPIGAAPACPPAQGQADIYVLHAQASVGSQLARLRELRERLPLSPLAVWCQGMRELDQVLALETGADDVLDVACSSAVLGARLRALWRRCSRAAGQASAPDELRFGRLSLQRHTRRVALGPTEVQLTEGEFDVLWLLASHAGTPVSREHILRQVRGLELVQHDRSIDSRVYRLRGKLRDSDGSLQRIRTVRNRGYLFSPAGW